MRVCMVSYSFYESDTRIMQYAKALVQRGDSVEVFALGRPGDRVSEILDGVKLERVQRRSVNEKGRLAYLFRILRFMITAAFHVTRRHVASPYRVIHIHSVPDFLVFVAAVPKLLGARVILDIHDILPEFYASKFNVSPDSFFFRALVLVERLSIAFSDHVIIANDLWKERLISRSVAATKCTAIINYPDPELFFPQRKHHGGDRFVLLYPGTLNHHQGLDIAIRAFARVAHKMPGAVFHIYGEGPEKQRLIELSHSLGISDVVCFFDFLPTAKVAAEMANADLAVVPKRASSPFGNEAASTKVMEFMAVSVPIIVSRTRIDNFYHDESRVKFVRPEDETDLAEAMYLLWSNAELREHLCESAAAYVQSNCWNIKKLEYLALVDRLGNTAATRNSELVSSKN